MKTRHLLTVALCTALAAPVASAQLVDRGRRIAPPVPQVDRAVERTMDRVDRMREREAERAAEARAEADAAAHSRVAVDDTWVALDVDADARLSAEEVAADATLSAAFLELDADGDGFLDDAEYRAHLQARHVAEASARGAASAAVHSTAATRGTWADLDVDADGRISLDEATVDAGFDAAFGEMDTDADGFVSEAEYRAYAQARLQPR